MTFRNNTKFATSFRTSLALAAGLLACTAFPAFAQTTATPATPAPAAAPAGAPLTDANAQQLNVLFARLSQAQSQLDKSNAATPSTSERVQKVLSGALSLLGTPYRWGGTTTSGFDCSGMVGYVFRTALGIELPRVSRDMATTGTHIERARLAAGDLVFFSRNGGRVDHVGIYVGNGEFVHAPRTGKDVMVSKLDAGYWSAKFIEARRVAGI